MATLRENLRENLSDLNLLYLYYSESRRRNNPQHIFHDQHNFSVIVRFYR
jgi:hypothetical protein